MSVEKKGKNSHNPNQQIKIFSIGDYLVLWLIITVVKYSKMITLTNIKNSYLWFTWLILSLDLHDRLLVFYYWLYKKKTDTFTQLRRHTFLWFCTDIFIWRCFLLFNLETTFHSRLIKTTFQSCTKKILLSCFLCWLTLVLESNN